MQKWDELKSSDTVLRDLLQSYPILKQLHYISWTLKEIAKSHHNGPQRNSGDMFFCPAKFQNTYIVQANSRKHLLSSQIPGRMI